MSETSANGGQPATPDRLEQLRETKAATLDEHRPDAVAKQHGRGRWTARQRIDAFFDPGTFVEYGQLARPATSSLGPGQADGLVMGVGRVGGETVCALTYDYTVFGGSQSPRNHRKMDRMLELVNRNRWPVVCWSEGGGARATELNFQSGMVTTFVQFPKLSGLVPMVTLLSGPAFAGQANIAGCSDVIIATKTSTMGLSGPPLVLSATGEQLTPEELGPMDMHEQIGTVDIVVEDEAALQVMARHYLDYFVRPQIDAVPAPTGGPDIRTIVPDNPRRAYDVRKVVAAISDADSVLELRPRFGRAISTNLVRIEGRTVGIIANNPMMGAGAIDRDASDKFSRHVELCNAFDVPLLFLCDTPGFMIGTAAERTALVRHSARTLMALGNTDVPILSVILRKAYGLAYYVMGSDAYEPDLLIGWPTAEFGGMGTEGAVNIVYRDELAAAADDAERERIRTERTVQMKERSTGLRYAQGFAVDDIVDPADTRAIIANLLATLPVPPPRTTRKHPIDPW